MIHRLISSGVHATHLLLLQHSASDTPHTPSPPDPRKRQSVSGEPSDARCRVTHLQRARKHTTLKCLCHDKFQGRLADCCCCFMDLMVLHYSGRLTRRLEMTHYSFSLFEKQKRVARLRYGSSVAKKKKRMNVQSVSHQLGPAMMPLLLS